MAGTDKLGIGLLEGATIAGFLDKLCVTLGKPDLEKDNTTHPEMSACLKNPKLFRQHKFLPRTIHPAKINGFSEKLSGHSNR